MRLAGGETLSYDRLVVSPGVDFIYDDLPGLKSAEAQQRILHSWKAGQQTLALRKQLEASGALTDRVFDFVDGQQLLYSALKAQGNPVTLDAMPGSTHAYLSAEGWKVFLAAFPKAAARD